jgi:FOG: HEAT repeat
MLSTYDQTLLRLVHNALSEALTIYYGRRSLTLEGSLQLLLRYSSPTLIAFASRMLASYDPEARFLAGRFLLFYDYDCYLNTTLQLLADPDPEVRAAFALLVGSYCDPRALPELLNIWQYDREPSCRAAAAQALGLLADAPSLPPLRLSDVQARSTSAPEAQYQSCWFEMPANPLQLLAL